MAKGIFEFAAAAAVELVFDRPEHFEPCSGRAGRERTGSST
jgi:hypothetical protein